MTKVEAKDLALKLWRYLRDNPECIDKEYTPYWQELEDLDSQCPLCEVFGVLMRNAAEHRPCSGCPLCFCGRDSAWARWETAECAADRRDAAAQIVDAIEAWDITEVDQ
jgi:hypothetical protein